MTTEIYAIEVKGNVEAINAFQAIGKQADTTARSVESIGSEPSQRGIKTLSQHADELGKGFTKVGRDVGVLGLGMSEAFAKGANDASGLIEAFSSGNPIAVGIAGVTVGVGLLAKAWSIAAEEEKRFVYEAQRMSEVRKTLLASETDARVKANVVMGKEGIAGLGNRAEVLRQQQAEEQAIIDANAARRVYAVKELRAKIDKEDAPHLDRIRILGQEENALRAQIAEERQKRIAAQRDAFDISQAEVTAQQFAAEEAADKAHLDARIKRHWEVESKRRATESAQAKERDEEEERAMIQKASFLKKMEDDAMKQGQARAARDMAEKKSIEEKAAAEAKAAAEKIESTRKKEDAERALAVTQKATAVSAAVEASAMRAMTPALDLVNNKLRDLGELNRETAKDFFSLADDAPAAAMKYAQGILAGIAMQAVGEAALEGAKAVGDLAGAGTAYAYGNAATGTALLQSAATHVAAAAGYAAIAGVGAGGALGVGMVRPLTNAEKKTEADKQGGGASSFGGAAGGGMSNGGSSGPAVNQFTIVYGAGSVTPDDRRRSTQVIAEATGRAQRNPFYQLANGVTQ